MPGLVVDDEVTSVDGVDNVVGVADVDGEGGTDLEFDVVVFADRNGDVLVSVSSFSSSILLISPIIIKWKIIEKNNCAIRTLNLQKLKNEKKILLYLATKI